jgi:hypothetical protein
MVTMNTIDFEKKFLTPFTALSLTNDKIFDKYIDEYLKTSRKHLLSFKNLIDKYSVLNDNHTIKDNIHYFKFIDTMQKESILHDIKKLILKQEKLYNNIIHHYKITNKDIYNILNSTLQTTKTNLQKYINKNTLNQNTLNKNTLNKNEENHNIILKENDKTSIDRISIDSNKSTKTTNSSKSNSSIYKINRQVNKNDTKSLNENKNKFTFFTRKLNK